MKKKVILLMIIGIVLIILGVGYTKLKPDDNKDKTKPQETITPTPIPTAKLDTTTFSGKYVNNSLELNIYQSSNISLYFNISNDTYGKASVLDNESNGTKNGVTYKFTLKDGNVIVESSDSTITGTYTKTSDLTEEQFYNTKYGKVDFYSKYNRLYSNEEKSINIYQSEIDKIYAFISNLDGKKVFMTFNIDSENELSSTYNGKEYKITLFDNYLLFNQEKFQLEGEIIRIDAFDLFNEYR